MEGGGRLSSGVRLHNVNQGQMILSASMLPLWQVNTHLNRTPKPVQSPQTGPVFYW
jgi:hypothetical protein